MGTQIRYLDLLEEDLLRAADFEVVERRDQAEPRRRGHWLGIAAGLVAFLLVAGLVGLVAGNNGGLLQAGKITHGAAQAPAGQGTTAPAPADIPQSLIPGLHGLGPEDASGLIGDLTKIIRSGDLSITLPREGLGNAIDEVTSIADEKGGFVFSSSVGERAGSMVLRVPAEQFDTTVTALREIGTVKDVTISAQDVTADFIDLNAHLNIARGRLNALEGLYAQANSIQQTLRVENALNDTQLRIEEIRGQLNVIENQTSQSTIHVSLREEGAPNPQVQDVENPSIGGAWDRAIAGFFGVIAAVLIGLGYLIPIAILALLVWFVVTLVRRRRGASPAP
jgi:hypothetical protein